MKIKTADLTGPALRYAVAVCEGYNVGVITIEEQWARFIKDAPPEEMEKYAKECAEIKAGFKDALCKIHEDGYKSAHDARAWNYDTDWAVVGPIVEREGIYLRANDTVTEWAAGALRKNRLDKKPGPLFYAKTPLIAAMRCYVASRLGDEVDVPEELL